MTFGRRYKPSRKNKSNIPFASYLANVVLSICLIFCITISASYYERSATDEDIISSLEVKNHQLQNQIFNLQHQLDEYHVKENKAKKKAEFISNEIKCLADNAYAEAGFEPDEGKLAVMTVVMNRKASPYYPHTVCGVVYQRQFVTNIQKTVCQFSWTCKPRHSPNSAVYHDVYEMAKAVYLKHERLDDVEDATLYHAEYVAPSWAESHDKVTQIGTHIFYK